VQSPEALPNSDLLGSLGRLVRGLSLLFWGLPIALVVCWQTAEGDWFRPLGIVPPLLATALLLFALNFLAQFQKQERIWHLALDRARLFAFVNLGLAPFLYWSNNVAHPFFTAMEHVMFVSGLCFLYTLNPVLWRLSAMLPDETLRLETKLFTNVNRCVLAVTIVLSATYFAFTWLYPRFRIVLPMPLTLAVAVFWITLFLFLLPVAMTMALTWKIKEAIFASVFGAGAER
jgi:hypothetical protein